MKRIVWIPAFLFAMAALAVGQDIPKVINGGVLNGKAIKLPKPAYPAEAKAAKLEGTVRIKVTIDEEGNVTDAELSMEPYDVVQSGVVRVKVDPEHVDPILAEAARDAALEAKFSPTRLSGRPVKVTGIIVYNFLSGQNDDLKSRMDNGPLNSRALDLPRPAYPDAARVIRAQGAVSVMVTIDENGDVISATAVSGHPLLRAAATEAARGARFDTTYLAGQPVKVSGVLTYNFVLPDPNQD